MSTGISFYITNFVFTSYIVFVFLVILYSILDLVRFLPSYKFFDLVFVVVLDFMLFWSVKDDHIVG